MEWKHLFRPEIVGCGLSYYRPAEQVAEEKRTEAIELHMGDQ